MKIEIRKTNIIKSQELDISNDVSIIYGYNNSGKTTILKEINKAVYDKIKEGFFKDDVYTDICIYIPTNRVIVSDTKTEYDKFSDIEEVINYEKNMFEGYDLHLKKIRDYLLEYDIVNLYLFEVIKKLFDIELPVNNNKLYTNNKKYSDGIENIINIYLNIIWMLTWDIDISRLDKCQFEEIITSKKGYILIDEIEMFLHVNIQSKLINALKEDFKEGSFIFTTHSPLLLTRYKNTNLYNIENGELLQIDQKLFYEDLNRIFQVYFNVQELPNDIKDEINYLGHILMKEVEFDNRRINYIDELLEKDYPSLHRKYNKIITKAKFIGEKYV